MTTGSTTAWSTIAHFFVESNKPGRTFARAKGFVWKTCRSNGGCTSLHRRNHELLELPVRHRERPRAQRLVRELHAVAAEGHAAAQRLRNLREFLRRAERAEARGEVLQCLFGEVGVRVRGEERAVDLAVLQAFENLARLR